MSSSGPAIGDAAAEEALRGARVLVLDDEATIRSLLETTLRMAGGEVETAADGRSGLQLLMKREFDVLVVDLRMAEMDGTAFLQEALKIWPWLGVVVITGYADEEALAGIRHIGITRVLRKPLRLADLVTNVGQEVLTRKQRAERTGVFSIEQFQHQLRMLAQISEAAIQAESLTAALRSLSSGLGHLLPGEVVGILGLDEDERVLILSVRQPVGMRFVESVQREMLARYEALSGKALSRDALRIQVEGFRPDGGETPRRLASSVTVPIIAAGEVSGLLALAASSENAYSSMDTSFLYHAANQMSTILASLGRMRALAIRDSLTGLYNRTHLEEELSRLWLESRRYGHPIGIVILDVDNFKVLNDSYGHLVGDDLLREFAGLLKAEARLSDVIGRYGGDEFILVLPQAKPADLRAFSERLLQRVRQHVFLESTWKLRLTISVGVASSAGVQEFAGFMDMLGAADQALYRAKRQGRNRVCGADQDDEPAAPSIDAPVPAAAPEGRAAEPDARVVRVLIVDDEPLVSTLIEQVLAAEAFECTTCTSFAQAVDELSRQERTYGVALVDLQLPDKSGIELLEELHRLDPALVTIVVTGYGTMDNKMASLSHGAYDFIVKPIRPEPLLATVTRAAEYYRLARQNARYQLHMNEMVEQRNFALLESLEQIKRSYQITLEALVGILDAREGATGRHSSRVRDLALLLGRKMGLGPKEQAELSKGAILHDMGKIGIPDAVLLKPGHLTAEEWQIMKMHCEIGNRILKGIPYLADAAEIVYSHHERYDGGGYPRGLKGEQIPLGARIFAVVDAYDAMRSDRPYRAAIAMEEAFAEIAAHSGTQFDPAVTQAFMACRPEVEELDAVLNAAPSLSPEPLAFPRAPGAGAAPGGPPPPEAPRA